MPYENGTWRNPTAEERLAAAEKWAIHEGFWNQAMSYSVETALAKLILKLRKELAAAKVPACSICCGSVMLDDGSKCVCGDGTYGGELLALRQRILVLQGEVDELSKAKQEVHAELRACISYISQLEAETRAQA